MTFHNILSIVIISLGAAVVFRILVTPLGGNEAEIATISCIGLIAVASWLLKHG